MSAPSPSLTALAVNNAVVPASMSDMVPVFQSIEKVYNVDIKLTHTGVQVRSRRGMGNTYFERENWAHASSGRAIGQDQCFAMRKFAIEMLWWARENMPTDAVRKFFKGLGYEH